MPCADATETGKPNRPLRCVGTGTSLYPCEPRPMATNHLEEKRKALFNGRVDRLQTQEEHDLYDAIEDLTPFTTLNLSSKHMGCREAQVLSSAIIEKRNVTNGKIVLSITDLDLSRNNISDDGALALSRALTTNSTITKLDLW